MQLESHDQRNSVVDLDRSSFGQTKEKSLYDRLGGKRASTAVVDEFVARVGADKRINRFFGPTASDPERMKRFKSNLVDQICEAGGGPCKYKGKDMKTAHAGLGVSGADFDALVEDLDGPMKTDIVEKP